MSSYSARDSARNGQTFASRGSAPFRPSSRPNYGRRNWIDEEARARREAADAHVRAEEEFRKSTALTEANYPSLVAGLGGSSMTVFDKSFSSVTHAATEAEERERNRQMALRRAEERARHEISGTYIPRFRPGRVVEEEDDEPPPPEFVPSKIDVDGFQTVKKKARKPKRELTTAELIAKFAQHDSDSEEECDVNGELFERRRREEFY